MVLWTGAFSPFYQVAIDAVLWRHTYFSKDQVTLRLGAPQGKSPSWHVW